jgi:hypothetical protein
MKNPVTKKQACDDDISEDESMHNMEERNSLTRQSESIPGLKSWT